MGQIKTPARIWAGVLSGNLELADRMGRSGSDIYIDAAVNPTGRGGARRLEQDVVLHLRNAFGALGNFACTRLLVVAVDEATKLDNAVEGFNINVVELIGGFGSQSRLDAGGDVLVIDHTAGTAVAAVGRGMGSPGFATRESGDCERCGGTRDEH